MAEEAPFMAAQEVEQPVELLLFIPMGVMVE
jgi:hypothetical protein